MLAFGDALVSEPLRRRCLFWANRLSFAEVVCLVQEGCGQPCVRENTLWRWVQVEAARLDAAQQQSIQDGAAFPEPSFLAPADLYGSTDCPPDEFVVMTDGIGVKAQKPTRQKQNQAQAGKPDKRHDTDVMLLPRPDGGLQVICEGVSGAWSLVEAARAYLRQAWSGETLSVVAITDGAKTIRSDLSALFGERVRVVLDWYHLAKQVYENLSMAARCRQEREGWERWVLGLLWRGKVAEARAFLCGLAPRNSKALADLIGYLDKHSVEIIDYERRQQAGKPIGSGRMEKGVDQVVGRRQKGKGMSWTKKGSRALALLKTAELNARHDFDYALP